jgi:DNA-binding transcriptional regulator/RsmH inhibitor MraZ
MVHFSYFLSRLEVLAHAFDGVPVLLLVTSDLVDPDESSRFNFPDSFMGPVLLPHDFLLDGLADRVDLWCIVAFLSNDFGSSQQLSACLQVDLPVEFEIC